MSEKPDPLVISNEQMTHVTGNTYGVIYDWVEKSDGSWVAVYKGPLLEPYVLGQEYKLK